jgi:hypothetical protein
VKIREVEPENTIANIYLADIPPGIYLLKAENEVAVKIFKQ